MPKQTLAVVYRINPTAQRTSHRAVLLYPPQAPWAHCRIGVDRPLHSPSPVLVVSALYAHSCQISVSPLHDVVQPLPPWASFLVFHPLHRIGYHFLYHSSVPHFTNGPKLCNKKFNFSSYDCLHDILCVVHSASYIDIRILSCHRMFMFSNLL